MKTAQFNVRLTPVLLEKLKQYAWEQGPGVTSADVVREFVEGLRLKQRPKGKSKK